MNATSKKPWICPSAWNGAYYTHDAKLSPCCRFGESWKLEPGETLETRPELGRLREQMLSGMIPEACKKCGAEEEAGIESKRQLNLRVYPEFRDPNYLLSRPAAGFVEDIGIELGNACNLACITCNPYSSVNWNKNAEAAGYIRQPLFRSSLEHLRPHLASLTTLHLLGGEIFLMPMLEDLLELIAREGKPGNVLLKISTNATVFPNARVKKLLENFAMVHILCSVDAYGPRNEYIRYPSKWDTVEKTIARWIEWRKGRFNADVYLAPTISAYSLSGLRELFEWWQAFSATHGAPEIGRNYRFGYVTDPDFQTPQVLARQVREKAALSLKSLPERLRRVAEPALAFALKGDAYDLRPKLMSWTQSLDQARNLSATAAVPEIFESPL